MSGSKESLKVLVRIRPSVSLDAAARDGEFEVSEDGRTISVSRERKGTSDFTFSEGAVLGPEAAQVDVYSHCNLISDVAEGIDCCIMAYGQTSSGKTHSMYGKGWELDSATTTAAQEQQQQNPDTDVISEVDLGVVPRSVADLFRELDRRSAASDDFDFSVTCQILQIYNEKIYDLLQDKKRENPLLLREASRHHAEEGWAFQFGLQSVT